MQILPVLFLECTVYVYIPVLMTGRKQIDDHTYIILCEYMKPTHMITTYSL